MNSEAIFVPVGRGDAARRIAVRARAGTSPGLLWFAGLMASMRGVKATALDRWASEHGRACVHFDYSGHGDSSGSFLDGTISRWLEESVAVFDACCRGPQVLVGSSMGGWLALLLARKLIGRTPSLFSTFLSGMVLIAPAVDFTEELMWKRFPSEVKREIKIKGLWQRPSPYSGAPFFVTRGLIDDGRQHLLLGGLIETNCPVRIIQGLKDADVPWDRSMELVSRLTHDDVVLSLVKDGDHALTRPQDIDRILSAVAEF
jgi:pimeloyl-ACP methyl ester carboxylesterase